MLFSASRITLAIGVSLALSAAGCRTDTIPTTWTSAQVASQAVRITPGNVQVSRDRLYVEVTLFNLTDKPMVVERDAVKLHLANGRVLRRSVGMTSRHTPYIVQPGAAQAVNVDFLADGFEWWNVKVAEVDYSEALHIGADSVKVDNLIVRSRAVPEE